MVDVKLTGPTWVHGQVRKAGEIVSMDEKLAPHFGEVQGIEIPAKPEIPAVEAEEVEEAEKPVKKRKKSEE